MVAKSATAADAVLARVDESLDKARGRLFELLRIPSISTQPAHKQDVQHAAEWLRDQLADLGFEAAIKPTPGHPVVFGHHSGPKGTKAPRILFYGHYDVQPPDPLDLWNSPPFDPQIVEGPRGPRVVARGAVDDKGQLMMFVEALRAWKEAGGGIPAPVTMLLEGEEEIGSPNLEPFLAANKSSLAADFALISDTNMWDIDTPGITTRLRGMCNCEITLKGPGLDLHSGLFGGSALNPINALANVLGDLRDTQGRIQIPGFYDAVKAVSNEQQHNGRRSASMKQHSSAASACPDRAARLACRDWSAYGRDPRQTSTESGVAIPAREARRSFRPRHRPRSRSAWFLTRIRRLSSKLSRNSSPTGSHRMRRSRTGPSA